MLLLKIYNEQIGDLLDPAQRNFKIRDGAKNGFYVENLTEESVISYNDVTQILIKVGNIHALGIFNAVFPSFFYRFVHLGIMFAGDFKLKGWCN